MAVSRTKIICYLFLLILSTMLTIDIVMIISNTHIFTGIDKSSFMTNSTNITKTDTTWLWRFDSDIASFESSCPSSNYNVVMYNRNKKIVAYNKNNSIYDCEDNLIYFVKNNILNIIIHNDKGNIIAIGNYFLQNNTYSFHRNGVNFIVAKFNNNIWTLETIESIDMRLYGILSAYITFIQYNKAGLMTDCNAYFFANIMFIAMFFASALLIYCCKRKIVVRRGEKEKPLLLPV